MAAGLQLRNAAMFPGLLLDASLSRTCFCDTAIWNSGIHSGYRFVALVVQACHARHRVRTSLRESRSHRSQKSNAAAMHKELLIGPQWRISILRMFHWLINVFNCAINYVSGNNYPFTRCTSLSWLSTPMWLQKPAVLSCLITQSRRLLRLLLTPWCGA